MLKRFGDPPRGNTAPLGLAWNGSLYLAETDNRRLFKLRPSDAKILDSFPTPGGNITGLAFDGKNLWVADADDMKLHKIAR